MRNYSIIKSQDLYDENYLSNDEIYILIKAISLYIIATTDNKVTNDERIPLYRKGWITAVVSLGLFIIYLIMNNFI